MRFMTGSNNAVLVDNCQNLSDLKVQLHVTEDLVSFDDVGFSLQLNSYPQPTARNPNSTPQTTKPGGVLGQLDWFQYIFIVAHKKIRAL